VKNETVDLFIRQKLVPAALDWFRDTLEVRPMQGGKVLLEYYCTELWENGECKALESGKCGFQDMPSKYFESVEYCPEGPSNVSTKP
jgi:hypothetical protein